MSEPTTSTNRWEQYSEAGRVLLSRGDQARAAEAFAAAARAAEREHGPDSLQMAASLSALGQLCYQRREFDAAAEHFTRALAIRERALGGDHLGVAQSVNNLAAVHVARNDFGSAEPLLQRALAITERHRGRMHPDLAVNLNNLAKLYFKRGDLASAEPLLTRLLEIKRGRDPRNPEVATVLASLATLKQAMGEQVPAMRFWREAVAIREASAASPSDVALAPLLENLSDCCFAVGQRSEALALRQRALGIREHALGADHPTVAAARAKVVALRKEMDRAVGIGGTAAGAPTAPVRDTPREARLSMLHLSPIDAPSPPPTAAQSAHPTAPPVARTVAPPTPPQTTGVAVPRPPAVTSAPPAPAPVAPPRSAAASALPPTAGYVPTAAVMGPPTPTPAAPAAPEMPAPREARLPTPLPAARSAQAEDAVWWTPTAPPASPSPTPAAEIPPALLPAPAPIPPAALAPSGRRAHPSDEVEAIHLPVAALAFGPPPTSSPAAPPSAPREPVEIHIDQTAREEARAAWPHASRPGRRALGSTRRGAGGRMFVSLGVAAAVLGAAAYLFATRGAAPQRAGDLSASAPPKAQPSEPPGATAAVTAPPLPTSARTPAAVDVRPPTTEAVVAARPAAPVSNVPTGPVVAPLPSTGRAAAHREGGSKAAGLPEPPLPRIKTIRLDAVTRDIEAKASKRVDDATRVQVKQTFKQP